MCVRRPPMQVPFDPLTYLVANAARHGDAAAIHDDGEELSFDRLLAAVLALIADLRARGLRADEVVAVALPNVWRYVALELAIPALDAILLPVPMSSGRLEVTSALERSGAAMAITDGSELGARIAEVSQGMASVRTVLDVAALAVAGPSTSIPPPRAGDPDRIVQIALTSGTTGRPKLASLSARVKQLTFEGFTSRLGLTADDRVMPLSPITQGAGEMCLYALRAGATMIMLHEHRFDAARALALAQRSRATVLGGVPTMIARMLHAPALAGTDLSAVRATVTAGALLPAAVARSWEQRTGSPICSFFGAMDVGQLAVPSPDDPPEKRWTTVGRPHDRAELLICDAAGAPVPIGTIGEICMRGPLVQQRYWSEPHGPFADDGWAHFGDLGFVDEDGYVHVTGRVKDTIIRGGANINPLEVEDLLHRCARILDVCVVGRPDAELGERAVAFVIAGPGAALELADIVAFLEREGLARFKWPESLELVDALPMGSTGKVDRAALRERAARGHGG